MQGRGEEVIDWTSSIRKKNLHRHFYSPETPPSSATHLGGFGSDSDYGSTWLDLGLADECEDAVNVDVLQFL